LGQALRVRPNDGKVLLVAGGEAFVQQRFDESMALWKRAFESGPENRQLLIDFLAGKRVHVGLLLGFKPDLDAVRAINIKYSELRDPQQDAVLLTYYAKVGEQAIQSLEGVEAAKVSLELRDVYERLEQPENVLACLERANQLLPNDFSIRKSLGLYLAEQGEFGQAENHLQWCLQRQPESKQLQTAVAAAVKGRLGHQPTRSARNTAGTY
jgi:tetratricopeptide (TPR) repeat protein